MTTGTATYSTTGYALASDRVSLGWGWLLTGLIGEVRLRGTAADPATAVFVAVGPADRVASYLSGAAYTTVTGTGRGDLVSQPAADIRAIPEVLAWSAGERIQGDE